MKKFRTYIAVLCTMLVAAACSNEMETETTAATDVAQLVKIGHFPAFDETAQTRTIGTPDEGKTAWTTDDQVLLNIAFSGGEAAKEDVAYTFQYDGSNWKLVGTPSLKDYRHATATITAYYAPDYELSSGALTLKDGKTAGLGEILTAGCGTATMTDLKAGKSIDVDFSKTKREYSRLRVAALAGETVTLTSAAFTANNDEKTTAADGITATADATGNAFFYGSWTAGAELTVKIASRDVTKAVNPKDASINAQSYAIDLTPTTYNAVGKGTETDPYQIMNATQLEDLATQSRTASIAEAYFKLLHDIDLSGGEWTPIGIKDQPFKGHFDGNNHSVTGITIAGDIQHKGLFGYTAVGSSIENLSVEGTITNTAENDIDRRVGILVGYNKGTITNCSAAGTVTGMPNGSQALNVGGLVGYNDAGTITACSSTAAVEGKDANTSTAVGGLVGSNRTNSSSIIACYATGTVKATTGTSANVGGLVGYNYGGSINACYATGAVTAATGNGNVGSLVGNTTGDIWYCLTTGDIGKANATNDNNGEITGVGAGNGAVLSCHGSIAEAILNAEGIKGNTGTGFGMLNFGINDWNGYYTDKQCHYHWVAGSNTPVLAPGAP